MNIGLSTSTSDVPKSKSLRLQVQCGVVCVGGRHRGGEDWSLQFFLRVVQRKQADPRYWRGRIMNPSDAFADGLNERGFDVLRRTANRIVADRASLPNSVAGLCLKLETTFPPDQQNNLWFDPTPERWDGYTVPCKRVVKRFWIGEGRT